MARKGPTQSSMKSASRLSSGKKALPAQNVGAQPPPVAIVGVGASTGGIEAFSAFIRAMPLQTGLGFVFIQHLSPTRESMLAEILGRATSLSVTEVADEPVIQADYVYVVPPGRLMVVKAGALHLDPAEGMHHRGGDRFLTSLAEDQGRRSIGVILSGTATDGTLGLEAIKAAGGITFAQDGSAQHDGMPQSAISSGCVDFVLPPEQIAAEIAALAAHLNGASFGGAETGSPAHEFAQVFGILGRESGIDFSQYKSNTLHRRIRRRMALRRILTVADYAAHVESNAQEIEALYQDILIATSRVEGVKTQPLLSSMAGHRVDLARGHLKAGRPYKLLAHSFECGGAGDVEARGHSFAHLAIKSISRATATAARLRCGSRFAPRNRACRTYRCERRR